MESLDSLGFLGFRGYKRPKNLQHLWDSCDVDGKAGLNKREFHDFHDKLKQQMCQDLNDEEHAKTAAKLLQAMDVDAIFEKLDEDQDGVLDASCLLIATTTEEMEKTGKIKSIHADVKGRDPVKLAQHVPLFNPALIKAWPKPTLVWAPYICDKQTGQFIFDPVPTLVVYHTVNSTVTACYFKQPYVAPEGFSVYGDVMTAHPCGKGKRKGEVDEPWEMNPISVLLENDDALLWCTRGTVLSGEGRADLRLALTDKCDFGPDMQVHTGFWEIYTRAPEGYPPLRQQVLNMAQKIAQDTKVERNQIIMTGHSLGAALATLMTYDILSKFPQLGKRLIYCTFGGPRTGNKIFATGFNELVQKTGATAFRIANTLDVITKVPPNTGLFSKYSYKHVDGKIEFTVKLASNWEIWTCNHIGAYQRWLEDQIAMKRITLCDGNLQIKLFKFWDFGGPCNPYAKIYLLNSQKQTKKAIFESDPKKDMKDLLILNVDLKSGIDASIDAVRIELLNKQNIFRGDKIMTRWEVSLYAIRLKQVQCGYQQPSMGQGKVELYCDFEPTAHPQAEIPGSVTVIDDTD